jgi:hypothetical protein
MPAFVPPSLICSSNRQATPCLQDGKKGVPHTQTSIAGLAVRMPRMADRFPDLHLWHRLYVVSDATLARNVTVHAKDLDRKDQLDGKTIPPAKTLTAVQEFDGGGKWPGGLRPFSALQLLGQALTPTLSPRAFDVARRWAFYRYFWAFEPPTAANHWLRLSMPAMSLVDHHRTLSSEQLGVALALHLAEWLVLQRHPGEEVAWVDADVALNRRSLDPHGTLHTTHAPGRRMRPDYFFIAIDRSTGRVKVYSVEAKGTHLAGLWRSQMAKAARQVAAIGIRHTAMVGGLRTEHHLAPSGLIFSTTLDDRRIVMRALDPVGDETWEGPARARERGLGEPILRFDPESQATVVDQPDAFRHAVVQAADASLLTLAGQYRDAAEVLAEDDEDLPLMRAAGNVPLERGETPAGDVLFYTTSLPLGDATLTVRTGVSADVLNAVGRRDLDRIRLARSALRERLMLARGTYDDAADAGWVEGDDDGRYVEGVQPTGSYLRIALE